MIERGRSRNQQEVRRALQKPCKRHLHRRGLQRGGDSVQYRRLQWGEPAQREEWNISDSLRRQLTDEAVIVAVCQVIEVLHANYLGNGLRLGQLAGGHVAHADMADEPLTLEFGEHGQRFFNRSLRGFRESANPEIDDVESADTEISQVVMNAVDELLAGKSGNPGLVRTATSAELGDD